jgi:hypothetical protein
MISRHPTMRRALGILPFLYLLSSSAIAATLDFTLTTNEPVTVTGAPRIAIDVGGVTRYAVYTAGSGTSTLTFSYVVEARDFDANGIALVSPLDLNGGNFVDSSGNQAANLNFTLPDTSGIRIQTYTTSFTTSPITSANANAVAFVIAKAPQGATYDYVITSSGGPGSVTGSGTINANPQTVSGIDVTGLPAGTLNVAVTISTAAGGTGVASQATAVLDGVPPTGYGVSFLAAAVNSVNQSSTGFQISGGEIGATYSFTISSSDGGTPVTGTGTVSADPEQITGLDLSGLGDGTLTISITLTDTLGNAGSAVTAAAAKDTVAPTILSVTPPAAGTFDDL